MWNSRGDDWGMHAGAGGLWVMVLLMTVLLVAVLGVLYVLVARTGSGSGAPLGREPGVADVTSRPADRLLDERFARGEISEDEYRRWRAVLHGG